MTASSDMGDMGGMSSDAALRLTLRDPGGNERSISFDGDVFRIGRARDCNLALDSGFVSRYHARVERRIHGWEIVDEGSKNGVFVNGRRVSGSEPLRAGDTVRIGDFALHVEAAEEEDLDRTLIYAPSPFRPEPPAAAAAVPALVDAVAPPEVAVEQAEPEAPPAPESRLRVDAEAGTVSVDGREVQESLGGRGVRLLIALAGVAPEPLDSEAAIDAVWGPGGGDLDMLARAVFRARGVLEADAEAPELLVDAPDGGLAVRT
jgi:hypothetical protein